MKEAPEHIIQNMAPLPAIRLGSRDEGNQVPWADLVLILVMRGLALLWLLEGVLHWTGLLIGPAEDFASLSMQRTAAIYFFCVMDFVAAVGLWLAAPWGGVVWLITVGVQILTLAVLPGFWTHGVALLVTDAVLVSAFLSSAWYAGHGEYRKA